MVDHAYLVEARETGPSFSAASQIQVPLAAAVRYEWVGVAVAGDESSTELQTDREPAW